MGALTWLDWQQDTSNIAQMGLEGLGHTIKSGSGYLRNEEFISTLILCFLQRWQAINCLVKAVFSFICGSWKADLFFRPWIPELLILLCGFIRVPLLGLRLSRLP
jgi:hypothetical protein